MEKIDSALHEFREMDELSARSSFVHSLNSAVKFIMTIVYVLVVVSFDKYQFNQLALMLVYPLFMFELSNTSPITFFRKMKIVLVFVCAVGIVNPFLDRTVVLNIGHVGVTGGLISMITLMIKGIYCLMATYILVATTSFDSIAAALRRLHVPAVMVSLLLLTYRYIAVLMEEVSIMNTAYKLRAPGQKGIHISAWGSFLGQLLLRSMDRAQELYMSMQLRGYNGEYTYTDREKSGYKDAVYATCTVAICVLNKLYDVSGLIGSLFVK